MVSISSIVLHYIFFKADFCYNTHMSDKKNNKSTTLPGVYAATKKDGTVYYRSSFTWKNKHISLGSYPTELQAGRAYTEASRLIKSHKGIEDYKDVSALSFEKWVILVNMRDNDMYFATPIYLHPKYFSYYLSRNEELKFSSDDLFYYASHKIMRRGRHLFVADYGMQVSIVNRYGIKSHAVEGKDYIHKNGDSLDFRYENIEVTNAYHGVTFTTHYRKLKYQAKIHIHGDYIVGYYDSAVDAAIAYNKAIDILHRNGVKKDFKVNYIEDISAKEYADIYSIVDVSKKILDFGRN